MGKGYWSILVVILPQYKDRRVHHTIPSLLCMSGWTEA